MTKIELSLFFKGLWRYLKPYKSFSFLFAACLIAQISFVISAPLICRYILDVVIQSRNLTLLGFIALGLSGGYIFLRLIPEYVLIRMATRLASEVTAKMRIQLFQHLESLPVDTFNKMGVSEAVAAFSEDIKAIESVLLSSCTSILRYLCVIFLSYIIIFYIYYPIALLVLCINAASLMIPQLYTTRRDRAIRKFRQKEKELMFGFHEFLNTYVILRLYNLLDRWLDKTSATITQTAALSKVANHYTLLSGNMFSASLFLCEMSVIVAGAFAVIQHYSTVGSILSLLLLTSFILRGTDILTQHIAQGIRAVLGMERLNAFLALEPIKIHSSAAQLPQIEKQIAFENVSFADQQGKVLHHITLTLSMGKSVCFVGPSGSGKTALLKLLMRFIEPTEGKIIIDAKYDLGEMEEHSFRNHFGVVLQESLLFNLSIRENILLGKPNASEEEVILAAKRAKFHDDILLFPQEYDTEIGDQGNRLSGGQKQRLALARALIRAPKILLLDEVTSALDAITEAEINQNLLECRAFTTLAMATHRLQIAASLDYIYVLEHGEIVEHGSHPELLNAGGLYAELWHKQNMIQLTSEQTLSHIDIDYLKSIPILQNCPDSFLEKLAHNFLVESYSSGEVVLEEGSFGDSFFLVARGELEVYKNQQLIGSLREGDYFGEVALLYNVNRIATVKTRTYVVLLQLSRSHFNSLLSEMPELKKEIAEIAAQRLQK